MPGPAFRSHAKMAIATCGLLMLGGCAERQALNNNPAIEAACLRASQRAAPGSYMSTGVSEQRAYIYQSCMANGGTLPRAR